MEKWMVYNKKADFQKIGSEFGIDPVIARLIRNRDIQDMKEIRSYLYGTLAEIPSPWKMKDMERAVQILQKKITQKKKIRIIGDYDIDGVTATCILLKGLKRLNANVDTYIPDRVKDGYGMHEQLIDKALEDGIDTILTCDNGIAAAAEIEYAKKEKGFILGEVEIPKVKTKYKDRHVLVVVRGQDYKEDLSTIISYIEEVKPVLVGVDGGADALVEFGYTPDVIVGDMDSVSDETLKKAGEIVVHAYVDGRAPGLKRIQDLGLDAVVFPAPGTSEDIAMLTAYEYGAELIVAVGTHSNMIDFLEKGRKGMASTFLVRLKIGSKLIDAKGVNLLYKSKLKIKYVWALIIAALFPVLVLASFSPTTQQFIRIIQLKLKLLLNM